MASLRYILLLQKDVPKAVKFYCQGLGLTPSVFTERWAELKAGDATIALKAVEGEALCSVGYSPFLSFTVEDLQESVMRMADLGGTLDGPIRYPPQGK
ncbi:unnamed protein product, partial [Ostreobium quekettii]